MLVFLCPFVTKDFGGEKGASKCVGLRHIKLYYFTGNSEFAAVVKFSGNTSFFTLMSLKPCKQLFLEHHLI